MPGAAGVRAGTILLRRQAWGTGQQEALRVPTRRRSPVSTRWPRGDRSGWAQNGSAHSARRPGNATGLANRGLGFREPRSQVLDCSKARATALKEIRWRVSTDSGCQVHRRRTPGHFSPEEQGFPFARGLQSLQPVLAARRSSNVAGGDPQFRDAHANASRWLPGSALVTGRRACRRLRNLGVPHP
jgi:hypothetical protein